MPRRPLLGLAVGAPALRASEPPSLVIAIDTSRSLQATTVNAGAGLVATSLADLPAEVRVGVLVFDDAPRWVLPSGSPVEAARALGIDIIYIDMPQPEAASSAMRQAIAFLEDFAAGREAYVTADATRATLRFRKGRFAAHTETSCCSGTRR